MLTTIYSIIAFFKYYFYIREDKLIVRKGVFRKTIIDIPLDRIQSVNFEQNLLHRLFKVVKLNIDTAGSSKNELELNALDYQKANDLSEVILGASSRSSKKEKGKSVEEKKEVFRLRIIDLLKVGLTVNHIRSGGVIIVFVFWIYDNLRDVGFDLFEQMETYLPAAEELSRNFILVLFLISVVAIISLVISLARTVLKFYNLKMFRKQRGFVVESGLLNRREYAAKDAKIQLVEWSQNLLQKLTGIFNLRIKQASSVEIRNTNALQLVGLSANDISSVRDYILKDQKESYNMLVFRGVDKYFLIRRINYWIWLTVVLCAYIWLTQKTGLIPYVVLIFLYGVVSSWFAYKKKRFGTDQNILCVTGGVFGHAVRLLQSFKIQSMKILSSPFQRRRHLCSLKVYTAAGSLTIPDIDQEMAHKLKNKLLYLVESSNRKWM